MVVKKHKEMGQEGIRLVARTEKDKEFLSKLKSAIGVARSSHIEFGHSLLKADGRCLILDILD